MEQVDAVGRSAAPLQARAGIRLVLEARWQAASSCAGSGDAVADSEQQEPEACAALNQAGMVTFNAAWRHASRPSNGSVAEVNDEGGRARHSRR